MLSVFQIFKIIIGVMVFIFVMTFFLRVSDMYSGLGEREAQFETVDAFHKTAMQTYSSGNPSTFMGFTDFKMLTYNAPKLLFESGQKTFSVPVFMIPDRGKLILERRCIEYSWFNFCWVYAYPQMSRVLFTPIVNTEASRMLINDTVKMLPETISFGYCNGSDSVGGEKANFIDYVSNEMDGYTYEECELSMRDNYRLVTIGTPSELNINEIAVSMSGSAAGRFSEVLETDTFDDASDLAIFIIGGNATSQYKKKMFKNHLEIVAKVMYHRTKLVYKNMQLYNKQPCEYCSTPFPTECGYLDYNEDEQDSDLYEDFIEDLDILRTKIEQDTYHGYLDITGDEYEELKNAGCEQ